MMTHVEPNNSYHAKFAAPFAVLGIRTEEDWLVGIDYLPLDTTLLAPRDTLAAEVCHQLQAYLTNSDFVFDLSLHINGTTHQRRVWQSIQTIPRGKTTNYAAIATQLNSSPRAVGGACGANNIPIIIPCHRVITKGGQLGGFMNARDGFPLDIKRWLLKHEGVYD